MNTQDWRQIETEQVYKLSQAKFQGMTIQALQDLEKRMDRMENKEDAKGLISFSISAILGGLSGLISTHLGIK